MGAFTTFPQVAQKLHSSGIPVWFIRPTASIPSTLVSSELQRGAIRAAHVLDQLPDPTSTPIYSGLAGAKHLHATYRSSHTYRDISLSPLLMIAPQTYEAATPQRNIQRNILRTATTSQHVKGPAQPYPRVGRSHIRGRDKFFDVPHPWMPSNLPPWEYAMRTVAEVDRPGLAKASADLWGYWVPEPSLLLNSATRRERYIMNWLRIRPGWLYLLRCREARPTEVSPQWWRDFLYGETGRLSAADTQTRNSQRLSLVRKVFAWLFTDEDFSLETRAPILWFDYSLASFQPDIAPRVIWELFELGFRYELLALDRLLIPNTAGDAEEQTFQCLFGIGQGGRRQLRWEDFVKAMTRVNFKYEPKAGGGSGRVFTPEDHPALPKLTWDEEGTLSYALARRTITVGKDPWEVVRLDLGDIHVHELATQAFVLSTSSETCASGCKALGVQQTGRRFDG
ncbi:hypothetical protein ACG7TL_007664 [Trametes sanguinea]